VPSFNIAHWPQGSEPGTWIPVAQFVNAGGMRQAVEAANPGPGRYKVSLANEPNQPAGLVEVAGDGTARDVEDFE